MARLYSTGKLLVRYIQHIVDRPWKKFSANEILSRVCAFLCVLTGKRTRQRFSGIFQIEFRFDKLTANQRYFVFV